MKMKRFLLCLLLCSLLLGTVSVFVSCENKGEGTTKAGDGLPAENIPDDNVRNWYEIFLYSFADSDGDGIGDFRGATEKLEYVRDMGFNGIWLMPIMPSPSYHKYDITNYMTVDYVYGTMEDFRAFMTRAHELGIKVILDLVVNHTSDRHAWFKSACEGESSPYREYYNFSDTRLDGYTQVPGKSDYYESRFVSNMPDLNLDSPRVREEIANIMRFWFDEGVDGFRLDAVTSYYTNQISKNVAFLSWLSDTARTMRPDCYIVGEAWADRSVIRGYYGSTADSFFYFPGSQGSGDFARIVSEDATARGRKYADFITGVEAFYGTDKLMAYFLDNHDTDRITQSVGAWDLPRLKALYGMLSMMRGGIYVYYGDEIGMLGKTNDPNRRIGMLWDKKENTTTPPPGANVTNYYLPGVADQQQDTNSLLLYVRRAMKYRLAFPEIARGSTTILPSADPDLCLIRREWNGSAVTLVLNLSDSAKIVTLGEGTLVGALDADLGTGDGVACTDGVLTMDAWAIAILN